MRIKKLIAATFIAGTILIVPVAAHAAESGTELSPAAKECIEKLEDGGVAADCHEAPKLVLPEVNELIWGGAAFVVLFGLMWKFGMPSIRKSMENRTQKIQNDIDSAERANAEATQVLEQYQRQLADAKSESARIIEEARQAAEQVRTDLVAKAEAEAAEMRERNAAEIASAKDRLLVDLRSEVSGIAIDLASKVVEKNLDKATNEALIESYISQVGAGK